MEGIRCGHDNVRIHPMKTVHRDCLLCNKQGIEHGIRVKELRTIEKEWLESHE